MTCNKRSSRCCSISLQNQVRGYSFASQVFANEQESRHQVKRRVEVSMRNLPRDGGDAVTEAHQKKVGVMAGQGTCRVGEKTSRCTATSRSRWVLLWQRLDDKRVPKAQLCVLGRQDPRLTTLPTSWTSGGGGSDSAAVDEGHLMKVGDLKASEWRSRPDSPRQ